jgi:hypothetical protein
MKLQTVATALVAGLLPLVLSACALEKGKARNLFRAGHYAEAAAVAERALHEDPQDREVLALRDQARTRVLMSLLSQARAARVAGRTEDGLGHLVTLLQQRAAWPKSLKPEQEPLLTEELTAASTLMRAAVAADIAKEQPFEAWNYVWSHKRVLDLPEFAQLQHELAAATAAAGQRSCGRLSAEAGALGPYWTAVVARYCRVWEAPAPAVRPLTSQSATLEVGGGVEGATEAQVDRLKKSLAGAFARSAWSSSAASEKAQAQVRGKQSVQRTQREISIDEPWTENVQYTDMERQTVTEQVPYDFTEHYTESVPYTEDESYTYDCGSRQGKRPSRGPDRRRGSSDRTCTGTRQVTRYREEQRNRTVTRYRTVSKIMTVPVTRSRPEPRVFRYTATEYSRTYNTDMEMTLVLGGKVAPIVLRVDQEDAKRALAHDVNFPAAGVTPQRGELPTADAWFDRQIDQLEAGLSRALNQRWAESFCSAERYSLEEAARCAHGVQELPAAARSAVTERFQADAWAFIKLMVGQ